MCVLQDWKCAFLIPATRLTEPQGPLVSWNWIVSCVLHTVCTVVVLPNQKTALRPNITYAASQLKLVSTLHNLLH